MEIERKYATAAEIYIPLVTAGSQDLKDNPTIAAGDIKRSIDGAAFANMDTLPSVPTGTTQVKIPLSVTETTCETLTIICIDAAGAEWEDQFIMIGTYGNASARHAFDRDNAINAAAGIVESNVKQVSDDGPAADNLELDYDGTGYAKANSTIGTTTANTDMRGTDSAALATVCTEVRLAELAAANLPTDIAALSTTLGTPATDLAADVAAVLAAIDTDTIPELTQAKPSATPTLKTAVMLLYHAIRNESDSTATLYRIKDDAGLVIAQAALSDDGTTFINGELAIGV